MLEAGEREMDRKVVALAQQKARELQECMARAESYAEGRELQLQYKEEMAQATAKLQEERQAQRMKLDLRLQGRKSRYSRMSDLQKPPPQQQQQSQSSSIPNSGHHGAAGVSSLSILSTSVAPSLASVGMIVSMHEQQVRNHLQRHHRDDLLAAYDNTTKPSETDRPDTYEEIDGGGGGGSGSTQDGERVVVTRSNTAATAAATAAEIASEERQLRKENEVPRLPSASSSVVSHGPPSHTEVAPSKARPRVSRHGGWGAAINNDAAAVAAATRVVATDQPPPQVSKERKTFAPVEVQSLPSSAPYRHPAILKRVPSRFRVTAKQGAMSLEAYLGLAAARRNLSSAVKQGHRKVRVTPKLRQEWASKGRLLELWLADTHCRHTSLCKLKLKEIRVSKDETCL
jgi:hypothetical protein